MIWKITRYFKLLALEDDLTAAYRRLSYSQELASSGNQFCMKDIPEHENRVFFLESRITAMRAATTRYEYIYSLRLTFGQFKEEKELLHIGRA